MIKRFDPSEHAHMDYQEDGQYVLHSDFEKVRKVAELLNQVWKYENCDSFEYVMVDKIKQALKDAEELL